MALTDLLELLGFEVASAPDGDTGIRRAIEHRPDVCLIDVGLPDVDGFEVARRLRSQTNGEKLYLVALTGYGAPDDVREAKDAGFDLHMVKPIDLQALENIVAQGTSLRSSTPAS